MRLLLISVFLSMMQVERGTVKVDHFTLEHIMVTLSTAWDQSTESRVQCNSKLLGQLPLLFPSICLTNL